MLLRCTLMSLAVLLLSAPVFAAPEGEEESKPWQENEVQLPAAPKPDSLLPFFVSAASSNRFFVDGATLSVGSDGVVRYVLVVLSPEGARNVTFEGMRCETRERRIYASGRLDGTWSMARKSQWTHIQDANANRQHAALYLDYFCPLGLIVPNSAEAREALVRGKRSDNPLW